MRYKVNMGPDGEVDSLTTAATATATPAATAMPPAIAAAIESIRAARHEIIRIAAAWESAGAVDTSPLNRPIFMMQDALSELETLPGRAVDQPATSPSQTLDASSLPS